MSITSITLTYLGTTAAWPLDIMLTYPRQFIRHTFNPGDAAYDVSTIASVDDLNRNAVLQDLCNPSRVGGQIFQVNVTPGSNDPAPGGDLQLEGTTAPVATATSAALGTATTAAHSDHVHAVGANSVVTASIAANAVTTAKIAANAVTNAQLGLLSVATGTIQANAVTNTQLATQSVAAANIAVVDANGMGPIINLRKIFTAGAGGSADDVAIFTSNAPFKFRVLNATAYISTTVGGSNIQIRSATGGSGTLMVGQMSAATAGVVPSAGTTPTATNTIAANGSLTIRRSDSGIAGEVIIQVVAET